MFSKNATRRIGVDRLLASGAVAGPLFVSVVAIQAVTRAGFDLGRHPISLLSLGGAGWIQIANFVVTGVLYLAAAAGARQVLYPGRGARWGPWLIAGLGAGLVVAGVFPTDAGAGFPPGAPTGAPQRISWHGILHEVGFVLASVSWLATCVVLARRFKDETERGWLVAFIAVPAAWLIIAAWPDPDTLSVRLAVATALQLGFLAALSARLRRGFLRVVVTGPE